MASHDAMNREDGDADHVAVTQSDMTRATSAALQAAAAQGSAGQRPSPGGSAEMSAEASTQHHQEPKNPGVAAAGAGVPVDLQEAPESEVGTPDRHGRQPITTYATNICEFSTKNPEFCQASIRNYSIFGFPRAQLRDHFSWQQRTFWP